MVTKENSTRRKKRCDLIRIHYDEVAPTEREGKGRKEKNTQKWKSDGCDD